MYLPKVYKNFQDHFPEVFKDFKQLGISTRQAGPLDEKIQHLVKLGIAVGANSRGGACQIPAKPWLPVQRPKRSGTPYFWP